MTQRSSSRSVAVGGVLAAGLVAACADDTPTGPAPRRGPQLGVLAPGTGDGGCEAFEVTLGGSRPTVTPLDSGRAACGTLALWVDTTATFDSAAGVVHLPVGLTNNGAYEVVPPAYVQGWADSLRLVDPASWPADSAGGVPLRFTAPDSTGTDSTAGAVAYWWYDRSFVAPDTARQALQPGGRSRTRNVDVGVQPGVRRFRVVLRARADVVTPPTLGAPPDGVPDWVYADTNLIAMNGVGNAQMANRVVQVLFAEGTSPTQRAAAVASVNGQVVGGARIFGEDGIYLVQVPSDPSGGPVLRAAADLARAPGVIAASPETVADADSAVDSRRPADDPSLGTWRLTPDRADTLVSKWAYERVAAPLAWGCTTGSAGTAVAALDYSFWRVADLAPNVQAATSYAGSGSTDRHGLAVASIIGARGNNGAGMAGMMWDASLRLYDRSFVPLLTRLFTPRVSALTDVTLLAAAARDGARVVNVSGYVAAAKLSYRATSADTARADSIVKSLRGELTAVIRRLNAQGRTPLYVFSAGNVHSSQVTPGTAPSAYPAMDAYWNGFPALADSLPDQVVVVAASTPDDRQRTDSYTGRLVTVAAPGTNVAALNQFGQVAGFNQTSAATPMVSGLAGLLFSFDPRLTAADVKRLIVTGARRGGRTTGVGGPPIINAYESLRAAAQRPGAPLCGGPVYRDTLGTYRTRPDSGWVTEAALFSSTAPFQFPMQGGRQVLLDGGAGFEWQPAGTWRAASGLVDSLGNATEQSKLGRTLKGDTVVTFVKRSGPNARYDEEWDIFLNGGAPFMTVSANDAPKVNTGHKIRYCTKWPYGGTEALNCLDYFDVDTLVSSSATVAYSSARGPQGQIVLAIATTKTVSSVGAKYANANYWWRDATLESGNTYTAAIPLGTTYLFIDVKTHAVVRKEFVRSQANTAIGFSEDGKHIVNRRVFRAVQNSYVQGATTTSRTVTCSVDYKLADPVGMTRVFTLPSRSNVTDCYPEATLAP